MVTRGSNPNYVPPEVAFELVFDRTKDRLGAAVWDDEGKNVWWGGLAAMPRMGGDNESKEPKYGGCRAEIRVYRCRSRSP